MFRIPKYLSSGRLVHAVLWYFFHASIWPVWSLAWRAWYSCHRPEQVLEAQKRSRGIDISLTSSLDGGWMVSTTPRSLYPWERDSLPIVQGWVGPPGPVYTEVRNLASTRIRPLHRPACIPSALLRSTLCLKKVMNPHKTRKHCILKIVSG